MTITLEAIVHDYFDNGAKGTADSPTIEDFAGIISYATEGAPTLQKTVDCEDPGKTVTESFTPQEAVEFANVERIIDPDFNLLPVAFLAEGVQRQRAVARIALKQSHAGLPAGSGWGTGWLVSDDLLMTNNHVIESRAFAKQVRAEFNYQNDIDGSAETPDWFEFDPDDEFHTNAALDFTLVRVRCRRQFFPPFPLRLATAANGEIIFELAEDTSTSIASGDLGIGSLGSLDPNVLAGAGNQIRFPITLCIKPGSRWGHLQLPTRVLLRDGMHVNIVQHPRGRRKEVAVQQNQVDDVFTDVVRYTTDTEPGSSGSPVFNNRWDLVAIHHAAGEQISRNKWKNNQGIRMDRIVQDLRAKYPVGSKVRTELGI